MWVTPGNGFQWPVSASRFQLPASSRPLSAQEANHTQVHPWNPSNATKRRKSGSSWKPEAGSGKLEAGLPAVARSRDRAARLRQGYGGQPSRVFMSEGWKRELTTGDWRLATDDWRLTTDDWRLTTGDYSYLSAS